MAIRVKGTSFVYFPVPKVGCTSLKLAIMEHNQPQKYAQLRSEEGVHGSSGYRSPPAQWEWRTYVRPSRMQAFCVIRDPIDRFISGYRNRIVFHRDLGKEAPDMNEFALELARYCRSSSHIRHHFMPMVEFTGLAIHPSLIACFSLRRWISSPVMSVFRYRYTERRRPGRKSPAPTFLPTPGTN